MGKKAMSVTEKQSATLYIVLSISLLLTNLCSNSGAHYKTSIFCCSFNDQLVVGAAVTTGEEDSFHLLVFAAAQMFTCQFSSRINIDVFLHYNH